MKEVPKRLFAGLAILLLTSPILPRAMAIVESPPPDPQKPWLQWIVTVVMVIACAAIVFKNAKRSHQD